MRIRMLPGGEHVQLNPDYDPSKYRLDDYKTWRFMHYFAGDEFEAHEGTAKILIDKGYAEPCQLEPAG